MIQNEDTKNESHQNPKTTGIQNPKCANPRMHKGKIKKKEREHWHRCGPGPPSESSESKSRAANRELRSASVSSRKPRPLVFLGAAASEEGAPPVMADLSLGRGALGEELSTSTAPSSSMRSSSSGSKSTASTSALAILSLALFLRFCLYERLPFIVDL